MLIYTTLKQVFSQQSRLAGCIQQAICADAGYRKTFVANVETVLALRVDISPKIKAVGFQVIPKRWVVERTFAWLFNSRRLAKDFEKTITRGYD